jgi:hypothetical protein
MTVTTTDSQNDLISEQMKNVMEINKQRERLSQKDFYFQRPF